MVGGLQEILPTNPERSRRSSPQDKTCSAPEEVICCASILLVSALGIPRHPLTSSVHTPTSLLGRTSDLSAHMACRHPENPSAIKSLRSNPSWGRYKSDGPTSSSASVFPPTLRTIGHWTEWELSSKKQASSVAQFAHSPNHPKNGQARPDAVQAHPNLANSHKLHRATISEDSLLRRFWPTAASIPWTTGDRTPQAGKACAGLGIGCRYQPRR